jgi:hypothetical protein
MLFWPCREGLQHPFSDRAQIKLGISSTFSLFVLIKYEILRSNYKKNVEHRRFYVIMPYATIIFLANIKICVTTSLKPVFLLCVNVVHV